MMNVYLAQVQRTYGRNAFLPYAAGLLQAYAQAQPEVSAKYQFPEIFWLREPPEQVLYRMQDPAVLGLSTYIWNSNWNMALARLVKARYPWCLVVAGGPHVPLEDDRFFVDHPYIDLLVHGEGEVTFADILRESLKYTPNYSQVRGLSLPAANLDGLVHRPCMLKSPPREPLADLSALPSPYLTGVFDRILAAPLRQAQGRLYDFHALQETTRGCPYTCTFCTWGLGPKKVRAFPENRVYREMEWCGQHRIELLYSCDANVGILARDTYLAEELVRVGSRYGFPKVFRAAYAKSAHKRVAEIARTLHQAGLAKGITLSLQSLNPPTLRAIRRSSTDLDSLPEMFAFYRHREIPTYTEVILGLPEETCETFVWGIDRLLQAGQHEGLQVYVCLVLPNSELASPEYRESWGIQTVPTTLLQHHSTPSAEGDIPEEGRVVVATRSMPRPDWDRAWVFAWAVQALHCLGLTSYLAIKAYEDGIPYRVFYERLLSWAEGNPQTVLGAELAYTRTRLHWATNGGSWHAVLPTFGEVVWPLEEASFLRLAVQADRLYEELAMVYPPEHVARQRELAVLPGPGEDLEAWAQDVVWYGRKNPVRRLLKEV